MLAPHHNQNSGFPNIRQDKDEEKCHYCFIMGFEK